MPRDRELKRTVRLPGGRRAVDADVDAELAFHLDETIAELVAAGRNPDDARREALRRFGDLDRVRQSLGSIGRHRQRRERRVERWKTIAQDLKHAARSLAREPGLVAVVALTLALGIGANATMFGVIDRLLLQPPAHVRDDGSLSLLYFQHDTEEFGRVTFTSQSYPVFEFLHDSSRAFADAAASSGAEMSLGRGRDARQVRARIVTPNFLSLLGVAPIAGRGFTDENWRESAEPTAVVTADYADRELGGPAAALGRQLQLGTKTYTVVGVTPRGFAGTRAGRVDVFLTMADAAPETYGKEYRTNENMRWLEVVVRRRPGLDPARAGALATAQHRQLGLSLRKADSLMTVIAGSIIPARRPDGTSEGNISLWLAAVSALVLLVATANVANLLLARAARRRRELAVRLALGSGRARVAFTLIAEGVMLAALGSGLALLVARLGGDVLGATLLRDRAFESPGIDWRVLAFAAFAAVVSGVLAGVAPATVARRADLQEALRTGAREGGGRRARLRTGLLVTQAALSAALLVGAGLFIQSFRKAASLELGFEPDRLLVATPDLSGIARNETEHEAMWRQIEERVGRVPAVEAVTQSVTTPIESQWTEDVYLPEVGKLPPVKGGGPYKNAVSPTYFATMGLPLIRGRGFTDADREGAQQVAVITEAMARQVWPHKDPLGACFRTSDSTPCITVVGVTRDQRISSLIDTPPPQFFVPLGQWQPDMRALFVRTRIPVEQAEREVRRAIQEVSPDLPYTAVRPVSSIVERDLRPWTLGATMFGIFGALGLIVAALGLYSVVAHDVSQRSREIGVRMALGARRGQVVGLVVREGVVQAAVGLALGILGALIAARQAEQLLFQTSPREPLVYAVVAVTLLTAAVVAAFIPARRAARIDPAETLRSD